MKGYESTGIIHGKDIPWPSEKRLSQGPVVIIECVENIPCNPCVKVCPKEAISKTEITDLPDIDHEKCSGCALCVTECPGLAIFVVDCSYSETKCRITIPYEYLPRPNKGDTVHALDRKGDMVCEGEVVRVRESGKTLGVTLEVPREYARDVRGMRVIE